MEDLWKLIQDSSKKFFKWIRIEPQGYPPPGRWLHSAEVILSDVGKRGSHAMLIYGGSTVSSPLQDMWKFSPEDDSWVEVEAMLDLPPARTGHATCMLIPAAAAKKRRRRRLLMDGPGDVHIDTASIGEMPEESINGPGKIKADGAKKMLSMGPVVEESETTSQIMFVFGGSAEPGFISEAQDPSPL